jgi:hypothetical protein
MLEFFVKFCILLQMHQNEMKDDGYKIRDQHAVHFITFSIVEWVDVFRAAGVSSERFVRGRGTPALRSVCLVLE